MRLSSAVLYSATSCILWSSADARVRSAQTGSIGKKGKKSGKKDANRYNNNNSMDAKNNDNIINKHDHSSKSQQTHTRIEPLSAALLNNQPEKSTTTITSPTTPPQTLQQPVLSNDELDKDDQLWSKLIMEVSSMSMAFPSALPTTFPSPSPKPFPTVLPSPSPTPLPSALPTTTPTPLLTAMPFLPTIELFPSFAPTPSPTTGLSCNNDDECVSDTCRSGVCMASPDCYPLQHVFGTPFAAKRVNIVFVGSNFDMAPLETWTTQVETVFSNFGNYNMFDNPLVNAFYVAPSNEPSFCSLGCDGTLPERTLCCDIRLAKQLSSNCFPAGANLQTVVIHNDTRYGGAGYTNDNLATTTINIDAPLVAVHELGHSLFQLGDEYTEGAGNPVDDPNCASTSTCTKWSDLIGRTDLGYNTVGCEAGCSNFMYFVGEESFMGVNNGEVGAVNERFTCCTFQVLTQTMPAYCDVFDFSTNYLFNYCKNNDYQGYGQNNYDIVPNIGVGDDAMNITRNDEGKYLFLEHAPALVLININGGNPLVDRIDFFSALPGLYNSRQVRGDFSSLSNAIRTDLGYVLLVTATYYDGPTDVLVFDPMERITIPPSTTRDEEKNQAQTFSGLVEASTLEVVLDTSGRSLEGVYVYAVQI